MLTVQKFTFNPFSENTYLVYAQNKEAAIIDPGCFFKEEEDELTAFIQDNKLTVKRLLNTHAHIDHVFGNLYCSTIWNVPLELHEKDIPTLKRMPAAAELWGIKGYKESPMPGAFLTEGQKIKLGDDEMEIIFVPGHAPGHVAFISHKHKFVIGGDVLFEGSIGRTDLPGGSLEVLMQSIKEKFLTLPDDYIIYSGHGNETTVGRERRGNPFILEYC
ncbi:MAG TPA: MBL fold metallo-hydrolase [Flavobacteriales bacterium]|nr:MBL fold metallo-hydrolase [Flavobacteriales bacterium]